jgi:hypothetical protein
MNAAFKTPSNYLCRLTILILLFIISIHNLYSQTNVTTQHNNLKRTGWNNTETQLTQANISNGNFGKLFSRAVDDQIYTQPLVVTNLSIGGGTHNVVFVATVNNTVYAFDADDVNATTPYWQKNLTFNPANYRAIVNSDMTGACAGGYSDFSGKMGIVGTPVVDVTTNTLYVVARSISNTGAIFVQYLHALDITTGNEKPNSPIYITATYPGTGSGNLGGVLTFDQQKQNQRPGLLLYNGLVYLSWASHCDWGPYFGWIIAYDAATLQQKYVYNAAPDGNAAGLWMSGQAPAVDDNGFIYVATGNGTTGKNANPNDTTNRGESLLKLSTTSGKLKVTDFFTPFDYDYLNTNDLDYGSDGVMLIPNTNLSLSGSKESYLYLIDNTNMGGTTANNSNVLQQIDVNASAATSVKHLHGSPVYFKDESANEYIYAWAEGGLLKQFPFDRGTMLFDTLNKKVGYTALPTGMPGAMLSLSSNGSQSGSGILWASHPINGDANQHIVPGVLQAFDPKDVTRELWNSNWAGKRDTIGKFAKFVPPTIANGKVYMATFSNVLDVYGLNPQPVSACASTIPSQWHSADIGYVIVPGDVCYNSGTYTITASGNDIFNIADAFHDLYQPVLSNFVDIKAHIVSIQNTSTTAKCGVMFRANLDPGSPNVFMALTPGVNVSFQDRTLQNAVSDIHFKPGPTAPYWVRIVSNGNKYVGYISPDGITWTASDSVTVSLGTHPYVGIAYTSHNNTTLGTAVVDNVTIDNSGVLPVQLVDFSGHNVQNKYTQLKWTISNEINNDHFVIERSGNTTDFTEIGSVPGNGSPSSKTEYSFTDKNPQDGSNFYRLKQVDANGIIKYSSIVEVLFNLRVIEIYPNPAHSQVFIQNNSKFTNSNELKIELSDLVGQVIFKQTSKTSGVNIITINIPSRVITGMYVLTLTNSNGEKQASKIYISK